MEYIAKAYVKIPRESAQNLILELCRLDYKNSAYHPCDIFWFIEDGYFYSREYTTELEECGSIDCNAYTPNGTKEEAVRLFLQLAQMDEEDAATLPVLFKGQIYDSWMDTPYETEADFKSIKTLTPLEVAEAFKEGRIEL